ncbi:MAG: hypothetical protein Q4C95_12210 [Planctomycetia bacterium]|nr:hypothetical protein [Planctomycetia bacterium]
MCAKAKEKSNDKTKKNKAKKKISTVNNDNFLFLHCEKFVVVAVTLVALWMVVGGSGLDKFTLTPDDINQSATRAEENIKNSKVTPQEIDDSVVVYDYSNYSHLIKRAIKVNSYETLVRWDQSLFPDKVKRPVIKPFSVENLKAIACIGGIQYKDKSNTNQMGGMGGMGGMSDTLGGAAGGKIEGRQWITLTGAIPVRKQLADYMAKFGHAQYTDMMRDQPLYVFFEIERGICDENGKIDPNSWVKLDILKAYKDQNDKWAGIGLDPVSQSYQTPILPGFPPMAMSCPPMTNRKFGEEVANLPGIPLQSEEMLSIVNEQMEKRNKLIEEMKDVNLDDILNRSPFDNMGTGRMGSGMGGGLGGDMGDPTAGGMGRMGGLGGMSGLGGMGGMGGDGLSGGMGNIGGSQGGDTQSWLINTEAGRTVSLASSPSAVDNYLFRYFDFDVEPNKTYCYRVKLILANPNYGIDPNFVEDPEAVKQKNIISDNSELSNPVAIGKASRIFAEDVVASSGPGQDPVITIASNYFDTDQAKESLVKRIKVVRGQVANFEGQTHRPLDNTGYIGGMGSMSGMGGMGYAANMKKATTKTVNHVSDVCILDAIGGRKITGETKRSPGKILVLDSTGLSRIQDVNSDTREVNRLDPQIPNQNRGYNFGGRNAMMM